MKTREQFIDRWKRHVAGCIALGSAAARKVFTGPLGSVEQLGALVVDLDATTQTLLGQLYDDLADKPPVVVTAAKVATNGNGTSTKGATAK